MVVDPMPTAVSVTVVLAEFAGIVIGPAGTVTTVESSDVKVTARATGVVPERFTVAVCVAPATMVNVGCEKLSDAVILTG
jgi:hypothetical protein